MRTRAVSGHAPRAAVVRAPSLGRRRAGDWWCHRRTDIEHTAGPTESAIHALMMAEAGVPALRGLFCEVNAGVLAATYGEPPAGPEPVARPSFGI